MDAAGVEEFKKSAVSQWAFDGGELVRNGYGITKVRQSPDLLGTLAHVSHLA